MTNHRRDYPYPPHGNQGQGNNGRGHRTGGGGRGRPSTATSVGGLGNVQPDGEFYKYTVQRIHILCNNELGNKFVMVHTYWMVIKSSENMMCGELFSTGCLLTALF